MSMSVRQMVKQFQCAGCMSGSDTECGRYKPSNQGHVACESHVPGTLAMPGGLIYLGMPKGFTKVGALPGALAGAPSTNIRLWPTGTSPTWDYLNLPVWAHQNEDGVTFVRTYLPRINQAFVDVIEEGPAVTTIAIDLSKTTRGNKIPLDVSMFATEID